jgi:hypothetical protein
LIKEETFMSYPALTWPGLAALRTPAGDAEHAEAVCGLRITYRDTRQIMDAALEGILHVLGYLVTQLGSGRCVLMTARRRRGREAGL